MTVFDGKILLATDGSRDARLAAVAAVGLAESSGSELHVATVAEEYPHHEIYLPLAERAREFARNVLDEQVKEIERTGGIVREAHLLTGTADAEVVGLAEKMGMGLTVVGSRGFGSLRRTLLGSVSESIVYHTRSSVLVVRGYGEGEGLRYPPRKSLLAYDGSREGSAAARTAARVATAAGMEVHLVYVVPHRLPVPFEYVPLEEAEAWEGWTDGRGLIGERGRALLDDEARRLEAEGAEVAGTHLVFGKPDKQIVGLAEEIGAGMITVGSRGRSGLKRALMGSVSDSVVRHAHCPVLVVRSGEEDR